MRSSWFSWPRFFLSFFLCHCGLGNMHMHVKGTCWVTLSKYWCLGSKVYFLSQVNCSKMHAHIFSVKFEIPCQNPGNPTCQSIYLRYSWVHNLDPGKCKALGTINVLSNWSVQAVWLLLICHSFCQEHQGFWLNTGHSRFFIYRLCGRKIILSRPTLNANLVLMLWNRFGLISPPLMSSSHRN